MTTLVCGERALPPLRAPAASAVLITVGAASTGWGGQSRGVPWGVHMSHCWSGRLSTDGDKLQNILLRSLKMCKIILKTKYLLVYDHQKLFLDNLEGNNSLNVKWTFIFFLSLTVLLVSSLEKCLF